MQEKDIKKKRKIAVIISAAVLIIGGGTITAVKLTSDKTKQADGAVTIEATTENDISGTEQQASATNDDKKDDKKTDKKSDEKSEEKTTSASTAEMNNNISAGSNDNVPVSSPNGNTVPDNKGNGSSSGGNSNENGSSGGGNSTGNGNSTGGGNGSSGGGSSTGGGNSIGGGSSTTEAPAPVHSHNWVAVYKTIHHDEVSHTERKCVEEAWDEEVYSYGYRCWACEYKFKAELLSTLQITYFDDGTIAGHLCPNCGTILELDGFSSATITEIVHHPAVYEDKKVVDKEAYDEKVVDYYKCSCGETK